MFVSSLEVDNFRNLRHIHLQCSPGLNLIIGGNASGKTSVLEALYFLGQARSFRTQQINQLIRTDEEAFQIVAMLDEMVSGRRVPIGIQRSLREMVVRIDGNPIRSLAELAAHVPVLLLNPDSHSLLEDGPQQRRRFIDWGLFHAEQAFISIWKRYNTALRQRNAALQANALNRTLDAWDEELVIAAQALDQLRKAFCEALQGVLEPLIAMTIGRVALQINYRRGWPQKQDLLMVLRDSRAEDRNYGYTRSGPQRADFIIQLDGKTPQYLSRGQQKLLVIALILAQARLYQIHKGSFCILLIDDLPAELDRFYRDRVMGCLKDLQLQLFVTAIEADLLSTTGWSEARVFNIAQGSISQ